MQGVFLSGGNRMAHRNCRPAAHRTAVGSVALWKYCFERVPLL